MQVPRKKIKRRVWIFLGCGLGVSALWWIWAASLLPVAVEPGAPAAPLVRLAFNAGEGEGMVMGERAVYMDPTPLFFPTEWNFGHGELRESLKRQPEQVFGSFEAKYSSSAPQPQPYDSDPTAPSRRLAEIVLAGNEAPFDGLGHVAAKHPPLPQRLGFVEVKRLSDGLLVIAQPLVDLPSGNVDFPPMEFIAVVGSTGLVRDPIVTSVSTPEESGVALRDYLAVTFRLGSRLAPGLYRVTIGP